VLRLTLSTACKREDVTVISLDRRLGGCTFRERFSTECQHIYDYAVEKYEERRVEVQQMEDCIYSAINSSREHGTGLINDFLAYKTEVGGAL